VPDIVILDLDGTLIDTDCIGHLMGDWEAFHPATFDCPPRVGVVELAKRLQALCRIVVVTGKPERFLAKTRNYLSVQGIIPDAILMRPEHSSMPDAELKPALMADEFGASWKEAVICAIEDRDKMVDAWRAEGILCLQAAPCLETKMRKERENA
jgi:beta-phosphoglucomutase-like phosphatase (HAD superfamily)